MGKEKYISSLRSRHPKEQDEMYELAWILQNWDKAKAYAEDLSHCTEYHQLAVIVMKMHDENPDSIYEERMTKEKGFLDVLVSLCCMEEGANAHAAKHHIVTMMKKRNSKIKELEKMLCEKLNVNPDDTITVCIIDRMHRRKLQEMKDSGEDATFINI